MTFHYNKPLFNNFNLTLRKGITALVGSSGNGKSTLLNLLVKFYEPFRGGIILSNDKQEQNLKDIE
jgi:ATP-binding cassette, subfamily B, bacterial